MSRMLVIRAYFRKSRFQVAVIAVMLVLASLILGLAAELLLDYKENFFRTHDELNAEHISMDYASLSTGGTSFIEDTLANDARVSSFEIMSAAFAKGSCPYGDDGLLTSVFAVMRMSDAAGKTIGKFEIMDETADGDGYIPYIFKANGYFSVGDTFTFTAGGSEKSFKIKGFYSNMTTGTVNCRDVVILLSDEKFEEFSADMTSGYRVGVRVSEPAEADVLEPEIINELTVASSGLSLIDGTNYLKLSSLRYVSETIFAGILCAAAAVIVAVLMAIVAVSLSNYIKENMRNLGIMKAVGYESRNLSVPVILSLTGLSGVCAAAGYGLSYALLPLVNGILESQSGIPYRVHFLWVPGIITVGIMLAAVFLTAVLSIAKIRTILPIMAIRPIKNRGKAVNVLPLHKTGMGLNFSLGLKTVFSDIRKYAVFLVASCLVTCMLCVAGYCVDKILYRQEDVVRMVMGNMADVSLTVSASSEEKTLAWLGDREDVENYYVYTYGSVSHEGGDRIDVIIRDEEGSRQSEYLLLEGSLPQSDSEVAVNFAYASDMNLEVGSTMVLRKDETGLTYTVCGLFQDAACSGKDIALSRSGYEKLGSLSTVSYMVNLKDGEDIDAFIGEISGVTAINYRKFISGTSETYVSMLNALIVIIVVISLLIAGMVLSVIVNMILFNKRREHGIMKSLGFVTPQIVFQTAVSFVPVAVVGSLLGLAISYRGVSALFSSFVRPIGIYSFGDSVGLVYLLAAFLIFTVFTFAVTCLLSLKVRKTVPHDLFNNE